MRRACVTYALNIMSPALEVIDHKGDVWVLGMPGRYETYNGLNEMWVYVIEGPPFTAKYQQVPVPVVTEWFYGRQIRHRGVIHKPRQRVVMETFGSEESIK